MIAPCCLTYVGSWLCILGNRLSQPAATLSKTEQTALPGRKIAIVEAFSSRLAKASPPAPTVALVDETTAASSERFGRSLLAAVVGMMTAESEMAGTAPAAAGLPQQSLSLRMHASSPEVPGHCGLIRQRDGWSGCQRLREARRKRFCNGDLLPREGCLRPFRWCRSRLKEKAPDHTRPGSNIVDNAQPGSGLV